LVLVCVKPAGVLVMYFSGQPNFGAIEIDWNAVPQQIKLELRDVQGHFVHRVEFPISELHPSDVHAVKKQARGIQRHCTLETELPWLTRYRLVLLFFGAIAGMLLTPI
jgi:alkaline phosphatase D